MRSIAINSWWTNAIGTPGAKGVKKLYYIDIAQTPAPSDVAGVDRLPLDGQSDSIVVLRKALFADIGNLLNKANPFVSAAGLPDKIEGYAFGPDLPDGRRLLLATNDNDYADTFPQLRLRLRGRPQGPARISGHSFKRRRHGSMTKEA